MKNLIFGLLFAFCLNKERKEMIMKSNTRITQVLRKFSAEPDSSKDGELLFKNNRLVFGSKNQFEISVANDRESKIAAYNFIYKSYLEREYIAPHPSKMWYTIFDLAPDTITLMAKRNGKVCGVITIIYDSYLDLPCDELFHHEIRYGENQKYQFAEISSLGVDANLENGPEILTKLFNLAYIYSARVNSTTDFVITVNPKHVRFYQKKLLFEIISSEKSFEKVGGAPAVLLKLNFKTVDRTINNNDQRNYKRTLYKKSINRNLEEKIFQILQQQIRPLGKSDKDYFFRNKRNLFISLERV